jgi:hypothetical protein
MPLKKNAVAGLATVVAMAFGPAAAANAATTTLPTTTITSACGTETASQIFKTYANDSAEYSLAPNGTFANNAAGWTLSGGVTVAADTNKTGIGGVAGDYQLNMGPGSTAISPPLCVSAANPYFRFLLKPDFFGSSISTAVALNNAITSLLTGLYSWSTLSIFPGDWQASSPNPLAKLVTLTTNGTATVRLEFTDTTTWESIADVYVDPWAR